jgi:hypothetical protein
LLPAVAAQHLTQIGDIGFRLVRRQIRLDDGLGFGKAPLQTDHQREISTDAAVIVPRL